MTLRALIESTAWDARLLAWMDARGDRAMLVLVLACAAYFLPRVVAGLGRG